MQKIIRTTDGRFIGTEISFEVGDKVVTLSDEYEMSVDKVIIGERGLTIANSNYIINTIEV